MSSEIKPSPSSTAADLIYPIRPKRKFTDFSELSQGPSKITKCSGQIQQISSSCFTPWKGFPDTGPSSRPSRPVVEMTVELSEIYAKRRGSASEGPRFKKWDWESETDPVGQGAYASIFPMKELRSNRPLVGKINIGRKAYYGKAQDELQSLHAWQGIPHIVRIHGSVDFPTSKKKVIVLERAPPSLLTTLRTEPKLPFQDVLSLFLQFLEMHKAASLRGFVHGDLKPANCSYKEGKLFIYDLGLAHSVDRVTYEPNYLQSLWYRAPELILGKGYDASIDLWSIGCIMYQVFCGKGFITGPRDDPEGQMETLLKIGYKIGAPPPSFLEGTGHKTIKFASDPGSENLLQELQQEATRRNLSETMAADFIRLLTGILKYEERIPPDAALQLCNQIILAFKKITDESERKAEEIDEL